MSLIELPVTPGVLFQSFRVQLDGAVYGVQLRYNSRAGFWALGLSGANGRKLLSGVAIRLGVDLIAQYAGQAFAPGRLFALNYADPYREADRENFGRDVVLVYQEAGQERKNR